MEEKYCVCKHTQEIHWISEIDGRECCSGCIAGWLEKDPHPTKTPNLWNAYGHYWMHKFTLDNLRLIEDEAKRRKLI